MRCGTARKRLSDALDGALPSGRKPRLEAHLRSCSACRAYRDGLERIHAGARLQEERPSEFWASFEKDVVSKLADAGPGRGAIGMPFPARRRLAWVSAAILILAGAAVWYTLYRPATAVTEAWFGYEDVLDPILQAAESDPELAGRVDGEIRASIEELDQVPDAAAAPVSAADPLFWEGLNDDELRGILKELELESGLGGPQ